MKRKIITLFLLLSLVLQGCGGVSQEEYDNVVSEKENLNKELSKLQSDYDKISEKNKQLSDEKEKQIEEELKLAYPTSWAQTSFGEDCIVLAENEEYLQCICKKKYEATQKDIKETWKKIVDCSATLTILSDSINYKKVSVKFIQKDGSELIDYVLIRDGSKYVLSSVSGNILCTSTITDYFNSNY